MFLLSFFRTFFDTSSPSPFPNVMDALQPCCRRRERGGEKRLNKGNTSNILCESAPEFSEISRILGLEFSWSLSHIPPDKAQAQNFCWVISQEEQEEEREEEDSNSKNNKPRTRAMSNIFSVSFFYSAPIPPRTKSTLREVWTIQIGLIASGKPVTPLDPRKREPWFKEKFLEFLVAATPDLSLG